MQIPFGAYLQPTADGGYVVQMPGGTPLPVQDVVQASPALPLQYLQQQMAAPMPAQQLQISAMLGASGAQHGYPMPVSRGREPVTTIMLRNIPQRYNREMLIEDMNARGFAGAYDFFYLPIDFSTTHSVGYAFINFISEAELARFKSVYVGLKLSEDSPKVCEICDAKVQGKAKNVEFYRNSTVMGMEEQYHPVMLENGVRLPFPKPTRAVGPVQRRPPRAGGQLKH